MIKERVGNMKKISLIHPSRNRPEQAYNTFRNWTEKAENWNNFDYTLSLDYSDPTLAKYNDWIDRYPLPSQIINDNNSAIEAINKAAKISTGEIIIVISDDFDCTHYWDTQLLAKLEGKSDFIVKTIDGLQKTLITLPIMDRVYYNRFGYIYHPDYLHMHCDEEMTIVGHMLGKVINLDLCFPHNHYTTGKMQMDAINAKNNATWAHGQSTLDRRAKTNFGIENPLVKREDIVWR